jgi:lysophospholipase L1-like esterase
LKPILSILLLALAALPAGAADDFQLVDGDRVVLLGSTLIEREQRYGYWEAALTTLWPDRNITFRNLGWSGDTVWGESRAGFDSAAQGYQRLLEHTLALKPTVIFIGYGTNESFAGEAGLPRFQKQLEKLLDDLAPARARIVLLAPLRQEDLGRPLPDPARQNKDLRLYAGALHDTAKKRGLTFADQGEFLGDGPKAVPLTDDGMHLTGAGYWRSAFALERGLGLPEARWSIQIGAASKKPVTEGVKVEQASSTRRATLAFQSLDAALPHAPPTTGGPTRPDPTTRILKVSELAEGRFTLFIDGKPIVTATSAEWLKGVALDRGPEFDQAEKLRQTIVEKNRLYFYRWRPANETYLFGFRKHEQGQNAREIPQFDPLVAEAEAKIAKLRVPVAHTYELILEKTP